MSMCFCVDGSGVGGGSGSDGVYVATTWCGASNWILSRHDFVLFFIVIFIAGVGIAAAGGGAAGVVVVVLAAVFI